MKYIFEFKNTIDLSVITSYLDGLNANSVKSFTSFTKTFLVDMVTEPIVDNEIIEIVVPDNNTNIHLLERTINFRQDYMVNTLDGDTIEIVNEQDKDWWKLYSLRNPDLEGAVNIIDRHGDNINVYLLDSGIKINHPEFIARPVINFHTFNGNFDDNLDHGTAMASLIAGVNTGASNATVKSLKICDIDQITYMSDIIEALDKIFTDFNQTTTLIALVNCSWYIDKNPLIEKKINEMYDQGLVFVVAANSNQIDQETITPQGMENVITVGGHNPDFEPDEQVLLSNKINGYAPSSFIYVAKNDDTCGFISGTSCAAAICSAVTSYNLDSLGVEMIFKYPYNTVAGSCIRIGLGKKGAVNFADEQYNDTMFEQNRMLVFFDTVEKTSTVPDFLSGFPNKDFFYKLVQLPSTITSITFLDDLPGTLDIDDKGIMTGQFPNIDNSTRIDVVRLIVTFEDGTTINHLIEFITDGIKISGAGALRPQFYCDYCDEVCGSDCEGFCYSFASGAAAGCAKANQKNCMC